MIDLPTLAAMKAEEYRGWTIEIQPRSPFPYDFYEPSMCFGYAVANRDEPVGIRFLLQPMWLTFPELRLLTTPLRKSSAIDGMVHHAKRLLRISIDRFWAGEIKVDVFQNAPDWSPADWNKTRLSAGPDSTIKGD